MAIMSGTFVIGLLLNALTFNSAAQRLGAIHRFSGLGCTLKGIRAHLRVAYMSMATACKTFSHSSGSSSAEGGGPPIGVEVRVKGGGSDVEGIGIGGEGCITDEVGVKGKKGEENWADGGEIGEWNLQGR